ncbi:unnamed protein product, partial [Heterosigma akashiwo]
MRQFLVDDKGCVLIGCWGVPGHAFSDNAARAVCAALALQGRLGALRRRMVVSVGITTGRGLC